MPASYLFYMSTGTRLVPRKTGVFLHLWHVLMLTLSEVKAGLEKRFQGLQVPDGPDFRGREKMGPVGCTHLDSWRVSADMEQNPSRNGWEDSWPVSNQTRPDRKHGFVMPCDTRFFKSRNKPEDLSNFQSDTQHVLRWSGGIFFVGPSQSSLSWHGRTFKAQGQAQLLRQIGRKQAKLIRPIRFGRGSR